MRKRPLQDDFDVSFFLKHLKREDLESIVRKQVLTNALSINDIREKLPDAIASAQTDTQKNWWNSIGPFSLIAGLDVYSVLFGFLDLKDILRFMATCKHFRTFRSSERFWRTLFLPLSVPALLAAKEMIRCVRKLQISGHARSWTRPKDKQLTELFASCSTITDLRIDPEMLAFVKGGCANLKQLHIFSEDHGGMYMTKGMRTNLLVFLRRARDLHTLTSPFHFFTKFLLDQRKVENCVFQNIKRLRLIPVGNQCQTEKPDLSIVARTFPNLEVLVVDANRETLLEVVKHRTCFPNLKELHVIFSSCLLHRFDRKNIITIFTFWNNGQNLKSVRLSPEELNDLIKSVEQQSPLEAKWGVLGRCVRSPFNFIPGVEQ